MSDTVTTFALRDQEKFYHLGGSAVDYLTKYLSIRQGVKKNQVKRKNKIPITALRQP